MELYFGTVQKIKNGTLRTPPSNGVPHIYCNFCGVPVGFNDYCDVVSLYVESKNLTCQCKKNIDIYKSTLGAFQGFPQMSILPFLSGRILRDKFSCDNKGYFYFNLQDYLKNKSFLKKYKVFGFRVFSPKSAEEEKVFYDHYCINSLVGNYPLWPKKFSGYTGVPNQELISSFYVIPSEQDSLSEELLLEAVGLSPNFGKNTRHVIITLHSAFEVGCRTYFHSVARQKLKWPRKRLDKFERTNISTIVNEWLSVNELLGIRDLPPQLVKDWAELNRIRNKLVHSGTMPEVNKFEFICKSFACVNFALAYFKVAQQKL